MIASMEQTALMPYVSASMVGHIQNVQGNSVTRLMIVWLEQAAFTENVTYCSLKDPVQPGLFHRHRRH